MKLDEIRNLNEKELATKVEELEEELFRLRLKLTTGELEDTSRIGKVRKNIAVIKTIVKERLKGVQQ
jgi:large subunit ribosomal protein L29